MASIHLMPCPKCDHSLEVETTQAGQEVTCPSCQASIRSGSMRDIRSLPLAASKPLSASKQRAAKRPANRVFNALYAVSFLLIFVGLGIGFYYQYWTSFYSQFAEKPSIELPEENLEIIKNLKPSQILFEWESINPGTIEKRELPRHLKARSRVEQYQSTAYWFYGTAAVGLLFLGPLIAMRR